MIAKAVTIAILAVLVMTSPSFAFGGGGGGGGGGVTGSSPIELLMPDPPRDVTATAGNGMATVSFRPPKSDGGSPITTYTVTSHPGSITAKSAQSPVTVKELANGTAYTFTVTAGNSVGTGLGSKPSNSVTPKSD
jgi:hypothetical protein